MSATTTTIGELPLADPITGAELVEAEQNGRSVHILVSTLRGQQGANGLTAYQLAVADGFSGTLTQWLASLKGAKGDNGNTGVQGKSAYQVAVDDGYVGTASQWLLTLKGAAGTNGKSAYQTAVDGGFQGTEAQWLLTLKGTQGDRGLQGLDGTSIVPKGAVANQAALPAAAPANKGWIYGVTGTGHLWGSDGTQWSDLGDFRGPKGDTGDAGSGGGGGLDKAALLLLLASDTEVRNAIMAIASVQIKGLDDVAFARAFPTADEGNAQP